LFVSSRVLHSIGAAFNQRQRLCSICALTNSSSIIRSKNNEFPYENRPWRPFFDSSAYALNYIRGPDQTARNHPEKSASSYRYTTT
jgi:hypothetical protein